MQIPAWTNFEIHEIEYAELKNFTKDEQIEFAQWLRNRPPAVQSWNAWPYKNALDLAKI